MRIVATAELLEYVTNNGRRVFVWTQSMDYGATLRDVFVLEASTESPGADREFVKFAGGGIEVLFDPGEHGTPDELHLALKGRANKRVAAHWNGKTFANG